MFSVATIASPRPAWAGDDVKAAALRLTLEKLDRAFGHRPGPVHTCQTPGQYREQRARWAQTEARERHEAAQEWYESPQCRALGAATRARARRFLNALYPLTGWEEEEAEAREAARCDGSLDPAFSSWPAYWSMFI